MVFTRRFRREDETRRRSMKGDRREGRGGVGFTIKNYKYGCGANYMRIS